MRQLMSLQLAVQTVDARQYKRYATAATILLLHVIALRVLMHGHALRVQSAEKEDSQIAVYFLPVPHSTDMQKSGAHEAVPNASAVHLESKAFAAKPALQSTLPSTPIPIEPQAITLPPENTAPSEDIVTKSLKSIAKIDKELRTADAVARGSATMWSQDKFEKAISSAARSHESKTETYVTNDGRVVTKISGPLGGTCVSRAGDAVPDGIDHMQGGEKLQVVPCSN